MHLNCFYYCGCVYSCRIANVLTIGVCGWKTRLEELEVWQTTSSEKEQALSFFQTALKSSIQKGLAESAMSIWMVKGLQRFVRQMAYSL